MPPYYTPVVIMDPITGLVLGSALTAIVNAAVVTPNQANYDQAQQSFASKGVQIFWNISNITAGQTATLTLVGVTANGDQYQMWQSDPVSAIGKNVFHIYPGATAGGTIGDTTTTPVSLPMPINWFLRETFSDTGGAKPVTRSLYYTALP